MVDGAIHESLPTVARSHKGLTWRTIYSVDLRNRGSQAVAQGGSVVVDGMTWYLKGTAAQPVSGALSLAGLRLTTSMIADGSAWIDAARWFFPLSQLARFSASSPVAVWTRGEREAGSHGSPFGGVACASANGASFTLAELATRSSAGRVDEGGIYGGYDVWDGFTYGSAGVTAQYPTYDHDTYAMCHVRMVPWLSYRNVASWTDDPSWAPPNVATAPRQIAPNNSIGGYGNVTAGDPAALGAYFFALNGGAGANQTHYLTHVWVQQPAP